MIAAWLAGKLSSIIIFAIACLSIVLLPVAIIQTVRINGISLLGWYAIDGYKPLYEKLSTENATLLANQSALRDGLHTCNASVDAIKKAGDLLTLAAQRLADQARKGQGQLDANAAAVRAIKSSDEKCPVADAILRRGFQ